MQQDQGHVEGGAKSDLYAKDGGEDERGMTEDQREDETQEKGKNSSD
jgi:hypothetical protein